MQSTTKIIQGPGYPSGLAMLEYRLLAGNALTPVQDWTPIAITAGDGVDVARVPAPSAQIGAKFVVFRTPASGGQIASNETYPDDISWVQADFSASAVFALSEAPGLPATALALIASRLGVDAGDLDKGVLSLEYSFAAARLVSAWPCIGDPAQLIYPDSLFFDGAAALVVAARLFGPLTTGTAGIILKTQNADGDSVTYSAPPAASSEAWLKEAQECLYQVSCVKASLAASSASFNFFRAGNDQRSHLPCTAGGLYGVGLIGLLDYGAYPLQLGYGSVYYGG